MSDWDGLPGFGADDLLGVVPVTSTDWEVIPNPLADHTGIRLTSGEFEGVEY